MSLANRYCNPEQLDDVDRSNGLEDEDINPSVVQYLVYGKFKRNERDRLGLVTMRWLSLTDLDDSSVEAEEGDTALDVWEAESARVRARARRER